MLFQVNVLPNDINVEVADAKADVIGLPHQYFLFPPPEELLFFVRSPVKKLKIAHFSRDFRDIP